MRFVKAAASAAIVVLASMACATAKPVTIAQDTNLRKSPGTDSEVLTLMLKGTTVEVGKCADGWCAASIDGKEGFVIARNVGMGPRPAPRPMPREAAAVEEIVAGPPGPPVYYHRPYPYYRPYPYGYYGYRPFGWGWGWR